MYSRGTRIPYLLDFKNYLYNYFAMYRRLTRLCVRVKPASPTWDDSRPVNGVHK